jgi:peptide/nickel transport system permease protein
VAWILGLTGWMSTARLVRAEVLALREKNFILSARVMGQSEKSILQKHLIPNVLEPILVSALFSFSYAILAETSLSFLGIGVQPPTPSWGNLLAEAKTVIGTGWWLALFPGLAIFLTVFSLNVIAESASHRSRGVIHG